MLKLGDNEPCYLLHRRPYRESSFLIDIFSLNHGRATLLAKGAAKSKQASTVALLQPFQPLLLSWSGKSSLKTLSQIEAPSSPFKLKNEALYCAYYLNELILNLLPEHETNNRVFAWYAEAIKRLSNGQVNERVLRHFEFCLLAETGHLPDFSTDHQGYNIEPSTIYGFRQQEGFVADSDALLPGIHCRGDTLLALRAHRFAEEDDESVPLSDSTMKQAKIVMRYFIDGALNGRELKSRKMYAQMKQGMR